MAISENLVNALLIYMPSVKQYKSTLESLNKQLSKTTLTGKVNSLNVAETLLEYMEMTQERFSQLQQNLISNLIGENVKKVVSESSSKAQVSIDILIRNLFERTADVGFLATDDDIRKFMRSENPSIEESTFITARLLEYVQKYSVYEQIVLFDTNGNVRAHLDESLSMEIGTHHVDKTIGSADDNRRLTRSNDALIKKTLSSKADYVETFGHSDIQPNKKHSLIYSCAITDTNSKNSKPLGVLCLCFKFDDEMKSIFDKLSLGQKNEVLLLVDHGGKVIASSVHSKVHLDSNIKPVADVPYDLIKFQGSDCISISKKTKGYQGFDGLEWFGHIIVPLKNSFGEKDGGEIKISEEEMENSHLFSDELKSIIVQSEEINDDLNGIVLNGEIIASKQKAYELNPVLDNIRNISENINLTSIASISELQKTVISSLLNSTKFLASLAVDIMDRNLYERANDCRWWALTSDFRRILAQSEISTLDVKNISDILAYINRLYTVYSNLFVFNKNGIIVAVSNPKEQRMVGRRVDGDYVMQCLKNHTSQKYFASKFEQTDFYDNRHTYIYAASITDLDNPRNILGGIGIVFDSEPQFEAMLFDALPHDDKGELLPNCFGVFLDREGTILSSTDKKYPVGSSLDIDKKFLSLEIGQGISEIIEFEGVNYVLGCMTSNGYREYKKMDGYKNDIVAAFFIKI